MSILSQLLTVSTQQGFASYLGNFTYLVNFIFLSYCLYGFFLSNRIAGPLVRLQRHIKEVAEGKADATIEFRKGDYGSELAESFNYLVEKKLD